MRGYVRPTSNARTTLGMATGTALFVRCSASPPSSSSFRQHSLLSKTTHSKSIFIPTSTTHHKIFYNANAEDCSQWNSGIVEFVGRSSLAVALTAALCFVDPALAFKGGGPYGAEVTRGADLSGKDFSGKTMIKQDFKTSILRQAKFKSAKLLGASFFDADLTGADLSDADLRGVDFSLANLTKANLSNANLEGALVTGNTSFRGSNINGADFTDVALRDDQRQYLCNIADGCGLAAQIQQQAMQLETRCYVKLRFFADNVSINLLIIGVS